MGDLKLDLQGKVGVPFSQQRLLLSGKHLGDAKTLLESGVQPGSVLHLRLPVKGGLSSPAFKFTDVTNDDALQHEAFRRAPRYLCLVLCVAPGLLNIDSSSL